MRAEPPPDAAEHSATACVADLVSLQQAWEAAAEDFVAWARAPAHDSFERFHGDQFLELVPPPGRLTLDIGCGEGRLSRALKAHGHTVLGVDGSPTMVAAAHEADPSIAVRCASATALPVRDGGCDLAIAFMSLQDIDDMPGAIHDAARVLEPGGRLCVAIVHPLNSAGEFESLEANSPFTIHGSYLRSFRYTEPARREGVSVTFHSMHRPLDAYFRALEDAGFVVEALREHAVPDSAIRHGGHRRWQRLPLFLHLRALRAPPASRISHHGAATR